MKKYYKVLKDNFLWEEGAILHNVVNNGKGYEPVDRVFCKIDDSDEYVSDAIVENSPEWFARVYKVNLLTETYYKTKEQAKEFLHKKYKQ